MSITNFGNVGDTLSPTVDLKKRSSGKGAMASMQQPQGAVNGVRPPLASHQSNSLPSTPHLRSREGSTQPKSPTLGRNALNISPRSSPAEQQHPHAAPTRGGGCKYETAMLQARRRVPYSLGPEKLGSEEGDIKAQLDPAEDEKLSGDMRELYDRLLPSAESEKRRRIFIEKLEKLLKGRWPDHNIAVNVFGSTGNDLGTTDSDVDVCLTTDCKELEHVCSLAALLAKNGMEKVVCVSSAKVPIVKVWDPELEIACDMNVNNPIALENTELIRAYVSLDPRVRPLAMIIKYWAKRRILNDAALGGTLSSYTWICMILNFLQTRNPPILPSLQQQPGLQPRIVGGVNVAFDHNMKAYRGFGAGNTDSLGSLIFQFFRYYGHEVDFETTVMSVRLGKVTLKEEKAWYRTQNTRLCVEEPFNTTRNLGNTADDTSMRGIHIELRRAFTFISEGKLEECCEQYIRPQEEGKSSEIFIPPVGSRPVIPRAPAQTMRPPRNGIKNARHSNGGNRGQHGNARKSSNPQGRGPMLQNPPFPMTTQELQLQQQHQQHILHDELFRQYQYLQMQEQELRMQLQLQNLSQGRIPASSSYPHITFPSHSASENGHDEPQTSLKSGNQTSLSAPLRQQRFGYPSPFLPPVMPNYGMVTSPSSPHLANAMPDGRRDSRRASVSRSSAATANRAQSQPARSLQSPLFYMYPAQQLANPLVVRHGDYSDGRRSSASSNIQDAGPAYFLQEQASFYHRQSTARKPPEYMGHYIGPSPPIPAHSRSAGISPVPSQVGLAIHSSGQSPGFFPRMTPYSPAPGSPPLHPIADPREELDFARSRGLSSPLRSQIPARKPKSGPLLANGSLSGRSDPDSPRLEGQDHEVPVALSASASEDLACDTPNSSDDQSQDHGNSINNVGHLHSVDLDRHATPIGRLDGLKAESFSELDRSSLSTSSPIMKLKSTTYAKGDPLSPVREDPVPPPLRQEMMQSMVGSRPGVLSPSLRRMVIPEIPSFDSLQRKPKTQEVLLSRTNGLASSGLNAAQASIISTPTAGSTASSSAPEPLPQPKTSPNVAPPAQQNPWQTQGKKKKSKKVTEGAGKSPIINGEGLPKKAVERKGG